jgi:hypothetical protein
LSNGRAREGSGCRLRGSWRRGREPVRMHPGRAVPSIRRSPGTTGADLAPPRPDPGFFHAAPHPPVRSRSPLWSVRPPGRLG